MKRLLLVDTSFSAKPIYDYLVSTGDEIFVVGGNPNDALAKTVENYIHHDYSDIDGLTQIIEDYGFNAIVPGGNDLSYRVCSLINERLGLCHIDNPETEQVLNDKAKFRRFALEHGLNVPQLLDPADAADKLPVIVKPTDSFSGKGITVVRDGGREALDQAVSTARESSKSDQIVIEEFVQGQLYSHSAFIVDGELDIDFIVEEHCTVDPFAVDTSRVIDDFDPKLLAAVRQDITTIALKLDLVDGLIHTQFISDGSSIWLIEITRRCPGDLYSKLIEYSTGYPYAEKYAGSFLGKKPISNDFKPYDRSIIRHTISSPSNIQFHSLSTNQSIQFIDFIPLCTTGNPVEIGPNGRIAVVFVLIEKNTVNALMKSFLKKEIFRFNNTQNENTK